MAIQLYMDHHVDKDITRGLRRRGVDVLTAYEDGTNRLDDPDLLDKATELQRLLVTQDDDFLSDAARRQRQGIYFYGVAYGHQMRLDVGPAVNDLELIAKVYDPVALQDSVDRRI